MLALLRNSGSSHSIHLTSTFQRDVAWLNVFLDRFNGKTMIHNQGSPHIHAFVDASLSGVGAIWEDNVYAATYPPGLHPYALHSALRVDKHLGYAQYLGQVLEEQVG